MKVAEIFSYNKKNMSDLVKNIKQKKIEVATDADEIQRARQLDNFIKNKAKMPSHKEMLKEINKQGNADENPLQRKSEINKLEHDMQMNSMAESRKEIEKMEKNSINYQNELQVIKKDLGLQKSCTALFGHPHDIKAKVDHAWSSKQRNLLDSRTRIHI